MILDFRQMNKVQRLKARLGGFFDPERAIYREQPRVNGRRQVPVLVTQGRKINSVKRYQVTRLINGNVEVTIKKTRRGQICLKVMDNGHLLIKK